METFYAFKNSSGVTTRMQFSSVRLASKWLEDMKKHNPTYASKLTLVKVTVTRVEEEIDV
jgi:hypothetical protein